jgi:glycosyltransferase involved in cell wall biosynthesis
MPEFFRAADVLLVSLRADPVFSLTIPGKVQTYLAAGMPVLGMLDGEGGRVIEEAGAGYVCPAGRGDLLAENVLRMIEAGADKRAEMGRQARDYAGCEFDIDILLDQLEGWMKELQVRAEVASVESA